MLENRKLLSLRITSSPRDGRKGQRDETMYVYRVVHPSINKIHMQIIIQRGQAIFILKKLVFLAITN